MVRQPSKHKRWWLPMHLRRALHRRLPATFKPKAPSMASSPRYHTSCALQCMSCTNTNMLPVTAQTGHSTQMLFCKECFSSCSCLNPAYTSGAYGACHKFLVAIHSPSRTTCIRDVVSVVKDVKQMYMYMMHACRFCHLMSWVWIV